MYKEIEGFINAGKLDNAQKLIEKHIRQMGVTTDVIAILLAEVHFRKHEYLKAFEVICAGLKYNYRNYELYFMLAEYYELKNINQAYLCIENAQLYCTEAGDMAMILETKARLKTCEGFSVRPVSVIISADDSEKNVRDCMDCVCESNLEGIYKFIVVCYENQKDWLGQRADVQIVLCENGEEYLQGVNAGIKAAGDDDILLLDSTILMLPNALFCLRMGLYEEDGIGAAGSVTNYAGNGQAVIKEDYGLQEWLAYARECNVPCSNPYQKKICLLGFSLLLKHSVIEHVGLFDENFLRGYYGEEDLGIRIAMAGYRQILCRNSFVLCRGGSEKEQVKIEAGKKQMLDKWGGDTAYYSVERKEIIELISEDKNVPIHVLEVGCGTGETLARIEYLWPNAIVKGVEFIETIAKIGSSRLEIIQGDIEKMDFPYEKEYFDYVIFGDVLEHLREPGDTLKRLKPYMKSEGCVIATVPNIMHMSVVVELLKGTISYRESGILDKTHLRFFTQKTIVELFDSVGFQVLNISQIKNNRCWFEEPELVEKIMELPNIANQDWFMTYQYIIKAVKK